MTFRRKLKKWFFDRIRVFFVPDWNTNEDYICMHCGEPVLRRWLYCSDECGRLGEEEFKNFTRSE